MGCKLQSRAALRSRHRSRPCRRAAYPGVTRTRQVAGLAFCLAVVGGCGIFVPGDGAPRGRPSDVSDVVDAVPRAEPKSRYGNPESYVVHGRRYHVLESARGYRERGIASWYGKKFHGKRTSSGETYDMYAMSAAHRRLPLPTYVAVTHLENQRRIVVRVNDRGPFHGDRLIDLSYAAAVKLGLDRAGTARVEVVALSPAAGAGRAAAAADTRAGAAAEGSGTASPLRAASPQDDGGAPVIDKGRPFASRYRSAPVAAAPSAPSAGGLYIQVGSFRFRDNADRKRRELHRAGLAPGEVRVQAEQVDARRYYRVLIGPLHDDAALAHHAGELDRLGIGGYLVVEQ